MADNKKSVSDLQWEKRRSRWMRGVYHSAEDIAIAYRYFEDRTNGTANMGIDFEAMAEAMLIPSTGSAGGDRLTLMRSRKFEIERAVITSSPDPSRCWYWHRVRGDHLDQIADRLNLPERRIAELIEVADREIERKLT